MVQPHMGLQDVFSCSVITLECDFKRCSLICCRPCSSAGRVLVQGGPSLEQVPAWCTLPRSPSAWRL